VGKSAPAVPAVHARKGVGGDLSSSAGAGLRSRRMRAREKELST
jgi:hypothetical protein